ncbi:unnamed protein product [Commensalibacter communis]|nr:unnamed protein product [Commensalibacter communis]
MHVLVIQIISGPPEYTGSINAKASPDNAVRFSDIQYEDIHAYFLKYLKSKIGFFCFK